MYLEEYEKEIEVPSEDEEGVVNLEEFVIYTEE